MEGGRNGRRKRGREGRKTVRMERREEVSEKLKRSLLSQGLVETHSCLSFPSTSQDLSVS